MARYKILSASILKSTLSQCFTSAVVLRQNQVKKICEIIVRNAKLILCQIFTSSQSHYILFWLYSQKVDGESAKELSSHLNSVEVKKKQYTVCPRNLARLWFQFKRERFEIFWSSFLQLKISLIAFYYLLYYDK